MIKEEQKKIAPIWRLGFRPFFLVSTIAAMILPLLWIGIYVYSWPISTYFPPLIWHAHEMIFGFVGAVVAGFVLTASRLWANKPGISGSRLKVLLLLWFAARLAPFFVSPPNLLYAVIDLSFLILTFIFLLNYIPKEQKHRTIAILINILVLWFGNVLIHLGVFLEDMTWSMRGLRLGVGSLVFMIIAIAGRIIPTFSRNKFPGARIRTFSWLDISVQVSTAVFVLADTMNPFSIFVSVFAFIAACLNLGRCLAWGPQNVRSEPMLVFLYIAYFWMIVGFILRALLNTLSLAPSLVTHAFTLGGMGIMIYAMIPRVSLGHTGRVIKADAWILLGFVMINFSAIIRIFAGIFLPAFYAESVMTAGVLWILSFLILGIRLTPIWLKPRVDGNFG